MKKKNILYGFTLIELLVVIAIIGLISSMMLVVLKGKVMAARDVKRRADMATTQSGLMVYYFERHAYPSDGCQNLNGYLVCTTSDPTWNLPYAMSSYLSPLPKDPGSHANPNYNVYLYMDDVCVVAQNPCPEDKHHDYILFFMLEKNPQEDYCEVGQIDFGWGLRQWSTRCPD